MNEQIQKLSSMNPYRNKTYKESPWQGFLSSLGFRTGADAWNENMAVQSAEYDAALAQKQFDMEYTDPAAQVARMRAAGINPDLDGANSISPGEPGSMGEDPSTPMQSTGDEGMVMQVANGIMSAFSTALGVASTFQGVQSKHLDNLLRVAGFAEQQFPNFIPFLGEDPTAESPIERSDAIANSLAMAKLFARGNLPSRYRKHFVDTINGFWNSAPKDAAAFKAWTDRVTSKRGYFIEKNTLYDEVPDLLIPIAKEIGEMQGDIIRARQQADITGATADTSENENRQEYATALDADLQAKTENAQNSVSYENAQMVDTMRKHVKNIVDGLEESSKEGGLKGTMASVCMTLVSMLQLWLSTQGAPSISRSSSFNSGTNNFGADSFSKGKSSFSIGF